MPSPPPPSVSLETGGSRPKEWRCRSCSSSTRCGPDRGTDLSHEQGHRLEELGEATAAHEVDLELIEPRCAQAPEVLDDLIHRPLPERALFRPRRSDDLAESH